MLRVFKICGNPPTDMKLAVGLSKLWWVP